MSDEQPQPLSDNEYREQRIANLRKLEALGFKPFGQAFPRTRLSEIRAGFEENKIVRAAGRLMTVRRMGMILWSLLRIDDAPRRTSLPLGGMT